jgi:chromosome segregation ATPase
MQDLVKKGEEIKKAFADHRDLQAALQETEKLRKQIEDGKVNQQVLSVQVKMLEGCIQMIEAERDDEQIALGEAQEKNEELKKAVAASDQLQASRILKKLERNPTEQIKELIVHEERVKAHNEEYSIKLAEEKDKFDQLRKEVMEIEEQLRLSKIGLAEDTAAVDVQDQELAELNRKITEEQKQYDDFTQQLVDQRRIKEREGERNRQLAQTFTALSAKKQFIQSEYDYSEDVGQIKVDQFRDIMRTNDSVNETVEDFVGKLSKVQKEA